MYKLKCTDRVDQIQIYRYGKSDNIILTWEIMINAKF